MKQQQGFGRQLVIAALGAALALAGGCRNRDSEGDETNTQKTGGATDMGDVSQEKGATGGQGGATQSGSSSGEERAGSPAGATSSGAAGAGQGTGGSGSAQADGGSADGGTQGMDGGTRR
jgi:hypothetical protein